MMKFDSCLRPTAKALRSDGIPCCSARNAVAQRTSQWVHVCTIAITSNQFWRYLPTKLPFPFYNQYGLFALIHLLYTLDDLLLDTFFWRDDKFKFDQSPLGLTLY
jgi:hypothetical protein